MTAPLSTRAAIEKAAHWLRIGRTPPRYEAERIVKTLDAMALGIALGDVYERRADRERPTQFHRQEA